MTSSLWILIGSHIYTIILYTDWSKQTITQWLELSHMDSSLCGTEKMNGGVGVLKHMLLPSTPLPKYFNLSGNITFYPKYLNLSDNIMSFMNYPSEHLDLWYNYALFLPPPPPFKKHENMTPIFFLSIICSFAEGFLVKDQEQSNRVWQIDLAIVPKLSNAEIQDRSCIRFKRHSLKTSTYFPSWMRSVQNSGTSNISRMIL